MKVFLLRSDMDNGRGLTLSALLRGESVDVLAFEKQFHLGKPLSDCWAVSQVTPLDEDLPLLDFPPLGSAPVFSLHAVQHLVDLLERSGELLPLDCDCGDYFVYNVTHVIDALDLNGSKIDWFPGTRALKPVAGIRRVRKHHFRGSAIGDFTVFKVPHLIMHDIFVTEPFVRRVRERALTGFVFEPVWESDAL